MCCTYGCYKFTKFIMFLLSLVGVGASVYAIYGFVGFTQQSQQLQNQTNWNFTAFMPPTGSGSQPGWKGSIVLANDTSKQTKWWDDSVSNRPFMLHNIMYARYTSTLYSVLIIGLILEIIGMGFFVVNFFSDMCYITCKVPKITFPFCYCNNDNNSDNSCCGCCPDFYKEEENREKMVVGLDVLMFVLGLALLGLSIAYVLIFTTSKIEQKLYIEQISNFSDFSFGNINTEIEKDNVIYYEYIKELAPRLVTVPLNFTYSTCDAALSTSLNDFITRSAAYDVFNVCPYQDMGLNASNCFVASCNGNFTQRPSDFSAELGILNLAYDSGVLSGLRIDIAVTSLEIVLLIAEHVFMKKFKERVAGDDATE